MTNVVNSFENQKKVSAIMKNSGKDPENSPFFQSEDLIGSNGSISKTSLAIDTKKELPKEFVNYLKSLFDILDQDDCGYIRLTDIERYWDAKGPSFSAMIGYLRETSLTNGLVDFESLCTGLRLVIQTPNISSQSSVHKDHDWTSDSSEDSFRLHDVEKKDQHIEKLQPKSLFEERHDASLNNATSVNLSGSTSKVYFVGKESSSTSSQHGQEGLRGGATIAVADKKIDTESRSNQLEEELAVLKNGLTVIEKARKWYFKRFTAVQEEKLLLQQSDKNSLEQFQYEMLLHKTRRKELNLDETVFKCYKENVQELNRYITKLIESPHELLNTSKSTSECLQSSKEQLQQLKNDIMEKNKRITQLEREKSALIRDLFQVKASASVGSLNKSS